MASQEVGDNGCSQLMQGRGAVGVMSCKSFLSLYSPDETRTMKTILWLHDFNTFKKLTEAHIVLYARVFVRFPPGITVSLNGGMLYVLYVTKLTEKPSKKKKPQKKR